MLKKIALFVLLIGCSQRKPMQGYGLEQVTEDGYVDTDGDGAGDVPIEQWCPSSIADGSFQIEWWKADRVLSEAIDIGTAYRFKLRDLGDVWVCEDGEIRRPSVFWYCEGGAAVVDASGAIGLLAGSRTPVWIDELEGNHSAKTVQVWNEAGDFAVGDLLLSSCW